MNKGIFKAMCLGMLLPAILPAANSFTSFPDETTLLAHHNEKRSILKRAVITQDNIRYTIYAGWIGSGVRTHSIFIYRQVNSTYTLAYSKEYRDLVYGINIFPEFTDNSIILHASSNKGSVKIDEVSYKTLKTSTKTEPDR